MKSFNKLLLSTAFIASCIGLAGCGDDDCPEGQTENSAGECVPAAFNSMHNWDLANPTTDDQGNMFYNSIDSDRRLMVTPDNHQTVIED